MFEFISANIATIIVAAVILAIVTLIVVKMVRDRKNHKSSCGCGCSGCPGAGICHRDH